MIVRQFLQWIRTATAADRAEASSALGRAYLYSDLSTDDRVATEGALIMLLDDPSPLVREALAQALAFSENSPPPVILGLAADQPEVASWVLEHSPLLVDADLVDAVATGQPQIQAAIARRALLPCAVSAAIAEVGSAEACLVLIENESARSLRSRSVAWSNASAISPPSVKPCSRATICRRRPARRWLPSCRRRSPASSTARAWLEEDRARRVAKEACEKATVTLAAVSPHAEIGLLVRHLRESGQLTAGLVLRALLSGNVNLFEQALAELSDVPLTRVSALVHDRRGTGFRALYDKAGLPASTYSAFREAVEAMREGGFVGEPGGATRLKRRMVERVLTRCADESLGDIEPLLLLLRRFAAEAAREEARMFCHELVAEDDIEPPYEDERFAA